VQDLLGHALERPVRVDETVGRWRDIPKDARTRIGRRGTANQLGVGATLGGRFFAVEWDVAIRVRARSMADLERLLPGGEVNALLSEAAAAVLPDHVDWHACIEVGEVAVTPARLGVREGTRPRLGMTAWVAPRGTQRMRNDVRLSSRAGLERRNEGARA
jgi:type VI secretion system protein ImpH